MKMAILLKSGPRTDEAKAAIRIASEILEQGHEAHVYLLQEAVRYCHPGAAISDRKALEKLMDKGLNVHVLASDAQLRGVDVSCEEGDFVKGSYDSLIELLETSDRVVGIL